METRAVILASPAEPIFIKTALDAISTNYIEKDLGCDFLFSVGEGESAFEVGIQRKAFPSDFFPSLYGGRLYKELHQIQAVQVRVLLLEQDPGMRWSADGELVGKVKCNKERLLKTLWSIAQGYGVEVEWVDGWKETVRWIKTRKAWYEGKGERTHGSGSGPPGPNKKERKNLDEKMEWARFILEHVPEIGKTRAGRILEFNPEPLRWWKDGDELHLVPGITKALAEKLKAVMRFQGRKG